jgi:uncharacterized protein (DUF302 family)
MKVNIVTERQSRFGFDQTVEMIVSNAQKYEWSVPAVHDLQNSLAKSGKHVRPVKVIEICKPKYSGQMLELSDERIISVMMPCRISVYEKDDGKTYVGMLNAREMVSDLAENISRVMIQASDETFEVAGIVT